MEDWIIVFIILLLFGLGFIPVALLSRLICYDRKRIADVSHICREHRQKEIANDALNEFDTSGVLYFDMPDQMQD
ncbi:MAG: hypothetical protein J5854_00035 [Clostridia bacterium]|nr:hypothetical protein [Clostridia bacterium]